MRPSSGEGRVEGTSEMFLYVVSLTLGEAPLVLLLTHHGESGTHSVPWRWRSVWFQPVCLSHVEVSVCTSKRWDNRHPHGCCHVNDYILFCFQPNEIALLNFK